MTSTEQRQFVVDNFSFTDNTQKSDLLDVNLTSPTLINFCYALLTIREGAWQGQKLEVLAVRRDHPTYDGANGHSGGNAIDFAPKVDDADVHLFNDLAVIEEAKGIGCGGMYRQYCGLLRGKGFLDNNTDHIHVQVLNY